MEPSEGTKRWILQPDSRGHGRNCYVIRGMFSNTKFCKPCMGFRLHILQVTGIWALKADSETLADLCRTPYNLSP